jgi:hypothetical protein
MDEEIEELARFTDEYLMGSFRVLYDMEENRDFYSVKTEFVALDFDPPMGRQTYFDVGVAYISIFEFALTSEEVPTEMDLLGNTKFFLEIPFYMEGLQSLTPNPFSTAIHVNVAERAEDDEEVKGEEENTESEEEPWLTFDRPPNGRTSQLMRNIPMDVPFLSSQQRSQDDSTTDTAVAVESNEVPTGAPGVSQSVDQISFDASSLPSHAPGL